MCVWHEISECSLNRTLEYVNHIIERVNISVCVCVCECDKCDSVREEDRDTPKQSS